MSIGWVFQQSDSISGGNDGAIDTFAGTRIHSMVREIIQNSLDAHDDKQDGPIRVDFSLQEVSRENLQGMEELGERLKSCQQLAEKQGNHPKVSFYKAAAKEIENTESVSFLCVSDYNTVGLEGSTNSVDAKGAWLALIKGVGLTQKPENSLGSFGHGSKAPFTMAKLRSIFYLTNTINPKGQSEDRFQGKSILQSHRFNDDDFLSGGTGYYGKVEKSMPLVNEDIPEWALTLRSVGGEGKGTSILIPYTNFDAGLFPETRITVLANFFYVIKMGKLVVSIDGVEINQHNLEEKFVEAKAIFPEEQDFIDVEHTKKCFQTIDTIINFDQKHEQEIPNFGRIDWYLRVGGDDISGRNVAVARESGMFITSEAPQLTRFNGMKPFDMFVRVSPGEGSKALQRMENPEHNKFEFSRIDDQAELKKIKSKYNAFVKKVKKVLEDYAKIELLEEETVGLLGDILFGVSNNTDDDDQSSERGAKMYISKVANNRGRPGNKGKGTKTGVSLVDGEGGLGSGKARREKKGGDNASAIGTGIATIEGGAATSKDSGKQVESLRVNRLKGGAAGHLQVHFNCYKEGSYNFQIYKVGETDQKFALNLIHDGKPVPAIKINVSGDTRQSITLEVQDKNASNYALEGWLSEA
jgi:hypothetical protein